MRRVSNLSERGGLEVPTYSQLQAFNADSTLMLLTSSEGYRIRRVSDFSEVQVFQGFNRQVPRWHPTRSNILVHFDEDWDADVTLQETDVLTNQTTALYTFPDYKAIDSNRSFDELSRDGRWLAGYAIRNDNRREIFTFDLANRRVGLRLPLDQLCTPDPQWGLLEPDWLAPSPLGRFLVTQWVSNGTQRCNGLETYDLQTGAFVGRIVPSHPHGDLGITADGQEFFLTGSDHPDDPNMTGLAYYLLPGTATQAQPHYVQLLDWKALMVHTSCQGPPGVCLISATSWPEATCCRSGWQPFQQEIYLQYLSGGDKPNYGPVVRLAHHRSSEQGYWAQPHATFSQDGHYALFGSDWGIDVGQEHVDPYLIELVTQEGSKADLALTKTDSPDPVTAGKTLTYTVIVANNGPDTATGVTLTDTLPGGVTFVSATPSQGSCSGTSTITCNLGTLVNKATATVTVVVEPAAAGGISNTATVTSSVSDPNTANNTATVVTTVVNPPSIRVTAPNGGETWTRGSTQTIRWTSIGVSGNVKIELSRNGGTSWTTLFKGTANDGMQNWKVTKPATTKARIRVSRVKDPGTTDASDANFTIQRKIRSHVTSDVLCVTSHVPLCAARPFLSAWMVETNVSRRALFCSARGTGSLTLSLEVPL
jgi:uncharacterized repeat protein (TIGR01451 family)